MKVFPRLGFNELINKFTADKVVNSGRSVIPNRIGGVGSHKIMNTFNDVTLNMLVSKSINTVNTSSDPKNTSDSGASIVTASGMKSQESRVSDDGKFASAVGTMMDSKIEADESAQKKDTQRDSIIKLGKRA